MSELASAANGPPVVVVGAGLAGLTCALELHRAGLPVHVLEAAEAVGGRVRTDPVEGFLLDRGFQVLTTSYPEALRALDLDALRLGLFEPGALVHLDGRFERFVDPLRRPRELPAALRSRVAGWRDGVRLITLRRRVLRGELDELEKRPDRSTLDLLRDRGFGRDMVEHFLRPFWAGIFLERELATSSRFFEFTLRMFATGYAALPAEGMGAIPHQLAARLPAGALRLQTPVEALEERAVLAAGEHHEARAVVVATDAATAAHLLPGVPDPGFHPATCLYFDAATPPLREPLLALDGNGRGPVNHLCVPSVVSPSYAPAGRALVSASVVGPTATDDRSLEGAVRAQLGGWFGAEVGSWRLLRIDRITQALPRQEPGWLDPISRSARIGPGRFVCGDHRHFASLNGAMLSGRRAAGEVLGQLGVDPHSSSAARHSVP
jgi:phytoene dehydrogenase-like protein